MKEIELDILLKNRPGAFAEVCTLLAKAKINLRAFALTPINSSGILQIVVDNLEKARAVLKKNRIPFIESTVLTLECADKPGEVAEVSRKLAKAGVNIDFGFASGSKKDRDLVVFEVENIDKAVKILTSTNKKSA